MEADRPFLLRLYGSTREDIHLYGFNMSESEKASLIAMQFEAQDLHYKKYYSNADFLIIQESNEDVGRLYIEEWPKEIRIIDITIAPEHRGRGLGKQIMASIIKKAKKKGLQVSIHVAKNNRALNLYNRLGFEKTGGTDIYHLMSTTF